MVKSACSVRENTSSAWHGFYCSVHNIKIVNVDIYWHHGHTIIIICLWLAHSLPEYVPHNSLQLSKCNLKPIRKLKWNLLNCDKKINWTIRLGWKGSQKNPSFLYCITADVGNRNWTAIHLDLIKSKSLQSFMLK